jgi:hypothetical protein
MPPTRRTRLSALDTSRAGRNDGVEEETMTLPHSMLLAIDGSENAKAATAFAAVLAGKLHGRTMVATVVPEHLVAGPSRAELLSWRQP